MSTSLTERQNQPQTIMLIQAAEAGNLSAVEALIAAGVNVNGANEHGTTALMAAASHGHLALVLFLLESGADFKAKRFDGFDALALAVFYGHRRIVRELLGRGVNLKANDRLGTSPEMWASVRGFHDIAQVLTDPQITGSAVARQNEQISVPPLEIDKQPSSVASTYFPKPRYYVQRKSRKLMRGLASVTSGSARSSVEGSYVESTYVPKPRYRDKRKSRKLVRWLAYLTAHWQRLTAATFVLMLVCGLGIVAVLNLLSSPAAQPVVVTEASAPDDSSSHPYSDLQSSSEAQHIPSTPAISDVSAERSIRAEKRDDDGDGPQVDEIEDASRLPVVSPLPKSSERVDRLHPKEVVTPKQETMAPSQEPQGGSRAAKTFRSANVSAKSISSTSVAGNDHKDDSGAKAPPSTSARSRSSIKSQRPRRVGGSNDRLVPAATSGRKSKAKVIQWP